MNRISYKVRKKHVRINKPGYNFCFPAATLCVFVDFFTPSAASQHLLQGGEGPL